MSSESTFAYTNDEGEFLVRLARKSLTSYIKNQRKITIPPNTPQNLTEKRGVFVTLRLYEKKGKNDLRGCIGRPIPKKSLVQNTIDAAIDSGLNDWRFNQVSLSELDEIIFEVTALTPLKLIKADKPADILEAIEIGWDGLMIAKKDAPEGHGGLFLPQVPVEWNMSKKQYLIELCGKAGLSPDMWKKTDKTNLWKFQGEIFTEKEPKGEIERIFLIN